MYTGNIVVKKKSNTFILWSRKANKMSTDRGAIKTHQQLLGFPLYNPGNQHTTDYIVQQHTPAHFTSKSKLGCNPQHTPHTHTASRDFCYVTVKNHYVIVQVSMLAEEREAGRAREGESGLSRKC